MDLTHTFTEDNIWVGKNAHNFTVTILPEIYICRTDCKKKKKDLYYVWHHLPKPNENRIKYAKTNNLWLLKIQEKESNATGMQWLVENTDPIKVVTPP